MAKRGARILIGLICGICEQHNYVVSKNKLNKPESIKLKKYCSKCRKHTLHKEKKKLS